MNQNRINNVAYSFFLTKLMESVFALGWLAYLVKSSGDLASANMLVAIFWISLFVFELPTGYLTDKIGAKYSMLLSVAIRIVGFILFYFATNFYVISFACVLAGFSVSFLTGLFSLQAKSISTKYNVEIDYTLFSATYMKFGNIAIALGSIISYLLIEYYDIEYIWLGSCILAILLAIHVAFTWDKIVLNEQPTTPVKQLFASMNEIKKNNVLFTVILLNAIIFLLTISFSSNWQAVFVPELDDSPKFLALYTIIYSVICAIGIQFGQKTGLIKKMSLLQMIVLIGLLTLVSSLNIPYISFLLFLVFLIIHSWLFTRLTGDITSNISNEHAGTIFSIYSLLENLSGAVMFLILGIVLKIIPIEITWIITSLMLLFLGFVISISGFEYFNKSKLMNS